MEEKDLLSKQGRLQIAVSKTPSDTVPDRSFWKVLPKWLKVARLWYQRKSSSVANVIGCLCPYIAPAVRRREETASSGVHFGSYSVSSGLDVSVASNIVCPG